jgi:hypothetical protein
MGKEFNISGACNPERHYMVDISKTLADIKVLVDKGAYFTMNRARQFGKTTTLTALKKYLRDEYLVVYLDFQFISAASYKSEEAFVRAFARELVMSGSNVMDNDLASELDNIAKDKDEEYNLGELFIILSKWCAMSDKPIVLIIDEVDSASNNQVFLDFLAQLRGYYIHRDNRPIFQSVILAGVHDVKNIKRKIRPDDDSKVNSPWNISAKFDINMAFNVEGIKGMLEEYESDYHTGMNTVKIAELIFDYTSGYPFLVSRLCQIMDKELGECSWDKDGFLKAVKIILNESNPLFESLVNKLTDYQEIRGLIYEILFLGKDISYNALNKSIEIAKMYGFVVNDNEKVAISNRIFETILYNYFLSEELVGNNMYDAGLRDKNRFVDNGHLNMRFVLERFVETFNYIYGDQNEKFIEEVGRKYFMLFLKPIINGMGNCYVEARTRNMKRTDIIVDYKGEQFIVELKIWKGDKYNSEGEKQIAEYIEFYHLKKGYMLTFNFNQNKKIGVNEVMYGDIVIVEAVV